MLDKEIVDILLKYKEDNFQEIENINRSLKYIKEELESVHSYLATEFSKEISSIEDDSDMDMFHDIQILKKYIRNFHDFFLPIEVSDIITKSNSDEPPKISEKPIDLYFTPDEKCPLCKKQMSDLDEWYYDYLEKKAKKISILKCSKCGKKYVTFDEIEYMKNDTKYTSISLHNDYFHLLDIRSSIIIQVQKTISNCVNAAHKISDIKVQVPVVYETGEIDFETLPATYCEECKKYIVLKKDFDSMIGIVLCAVVDETTEYKNSSDGFTFEDRQSKLYQHGYHAQSKNALSDEQRHTILLSVLEAQIMTKPQICSYLDDLVERYRNNTKFKNAVKKWKSDREYVRYVKENSLPSYDVNKIILKYSYKG